MRWPATVTAEDASRLTAALITRHANHVPGLLTADRYYEGRPGLSYLDPQLVRLLSGRIRQVVVNWPRLVVDSHAERLQLKGFRLPNQSGTDLALNELWQANDLDEQQHDLHTEALVYGRAYAIVGAAAEAADVPLVTVESPLEVHTVHDPRTRQVAAAVKAWKDGAEEFATLYLTAETWLMRRASRGWVADTVDRHGLGQVPVVPFANRSRPRNPYGVSELADVIPLADAVNKIATDMMVSGEFHAMPRRVAYGFAEEDFVGPDGTPLNRWAREAHALWATRKSPGDARVEQLPEADLSNFHNTINQLARLVASLCGLPPHYLGFSTDVPASADAIRSSEARLVRRAEARQNRFGGSWERVMRLGRRIATGRTDPGLRHLEALWFDAGTPTVAQRADASVKLYADGRGPVTLRQTREDLGYSEATIHRMEADDHQAARLDGLRLGLAPTHDIAPGGDAA
ncbi:MULTISPECIES: phage portal protein [unclassified Crossiella]|uniref:phage portal protein n=1 Tax=unclassified Crossiella TaxID=2620835 RepID=UPI001FFE5166|nr:MULTISPECIES: phage portal protein [unclassified Crossiella]MCK2242329.1 phage portal protein [Crossiella sp. S99.2]MCK2254640.1 phage portal protein [Crossiella sp. S99.1]